MPSSKRKWYELTERVPDGPTTKLFAELAKKHGIVLIVLPVYEEEMTGVYYNTAAVIDADGSYLGKFRKMHIPQVQPGFWEKFYFRPGNLGYPVFRDPLRARSASTSATTAIFPKGRAAWAWTGRRSSSIPRRRWPACPNISGSSSSRPTPSANGYFVGAINRPGWEEPWRIGEFYGQSYFCDPRGKILADGSARHRRHRHRRPRPRPDPRSAQHLAVLSRSPAGNVWRRSRPHRIQPRMKHGWNTDQRECQENRNHTEFPSVFNPCFIRG